MPSILQTLTFGAGFTSILQSVCAFLKQDRDFRQAASWGIFKDREEQSTQCTASAFSILCCWHSCPTFLLLLPFLYPTAHTLYCSPLVISCLQCAASINTWHSRPSLCTSHAAFLRRKFMEWLSHFPPFLQAFQRRGSCAYNMLERTFP